jgi:hypothetical protein
MEDSAVKGVKNPSANKLANKNPVQINQKQDDFVDDDESTDADDLEMIHGNSDRIRMARKGGTIPPKTGEKSNNIHPTTAKQPITVEQPITAKQPHVVTSTAETNKTSLDGGGNVRVASAISKGKGPLQQSLSNTIKPQTCKQMI